MNTKNFFLMLIAISFIGCNPFGKPEELPDDFGQTTLSNTWNFGNSSDYTFNTNFIELSGGNAILKTVDLEHSLTDFNNGTHFGTAYSSSKVNMQSDASFSQSHVNTILDTNSSNLVGYWRLDGNFTDLSTTANTNTNTGVSFTTDAQVGSHSAQFTTGNSRIELANNLPLHNGYTVSFWYKLGNYLVTTGAHNILYQGKSDYSYRPLQIRLYGNGHTTPNQIAFVTRDNAGGYRESLLPVLDLDVWYHLTFVFDPSIASNHRKVYINGILDSEFNSSNVANFTAADNALTEFIIGNTSSVDAQMDELAIWDTALSPTKIKSLYKWQKTEHVGAYYSPIINTGDSSTTWNELSWLTELPFLKEIPGGPASEMTDDYVSLRGSTGSLDDNDLSLGLTSLWHFNESGLNQANGGSNDFTDSSVTGHFGDEVGLPTLNQEGVFGSAVEFDGVDDHILLGPSSDILPGDTSFTISIWVKVNELNNSGAISDPARGGRFVTIFRAPASSKVGLGLFGNNTDTIMVFTPGGRINKTSAGVNDGNWHHIVTTYDSTSDLLSLFIDGINVGTMSVGTIDSASTSTVARISSYNDESGDTGGRFTGLLDELAIWTRDLSAQEIKQLYQRGANRVKFQVRSCDDALCEGEDWLGPANSSNRAFFSELNNCNVFLANGDCNYQGSTSVLTTSPNLTMGDFSGLSLNPNRYFQYRALLESDDKSGSPTKPTFSYVKIGPTGKYYGGSPEIYRNQGIPFSKWIGIEEASTGSCTITYQASLDKVSWYYFDGSSWTIAADQNDSNDESTINTNAENFSSDIGTGNLYIKALLNSDTNQDCQLDELKISVESPL